MYGITLLLHSWLRWLALIVGVAAVGNGFAGWFGRREWSAAGERWGRLFTLVLDIQLLLGLVLYFVSPLVQTARGDFGAAMGDPALRFWSVEHVAMMVVALAVAHIGRAAIRKAPDAATKHRRAALLFGLALVIILAAIPWPFRVDIGRPWVRLGS